MCEVCYEEYTSADAWVCTPECGHYLCRDCYTEYVDGQLSKGIECVSTPCPRSGCGMLVPFKLFDELLEPSKAEKFNKLRVSSYVDLYKERKWCPTPNCG